MASRYEVVDEDHVGGQNQVAAEWKTIRAVFHNFAKLSAKEGDITASQVLKCHALEWQIQVYPGGNSINSSVFLYLHSNSCTKTNNIRAKTTFRVPSAGWTKGGRLFNTYSPKNAAHEHNAWGQDFAKREDVLKASKNYLVDGNLTVEIDIQVMLDELPVWTPTNTVCSDMLKILDSADAENADVLFEIGGGDKVTARSREDEFQTYYAHKIILSKRAPALAALADDCSPGTAIPISNVHPALFRMLLRFIYGGEVPGKDVLKEEARDIIKTSDRFGCTGLKLAAEAKLASAGIAVDNAAELILFADGMNCAMLKEAAMEFFVKNAQAVMASDGFQQVKESPAILTELMAVGFGGDKKRPASSDADSESDYKRMRVSTLRQKLDHKGLDVDGSKEMLFSRLEAAEAEARAQAEAQAEAEAEAENDDDEEDE